MKFKTGNFTVKIEWGWTQFMGLMGMPLGKIPVSSVNAPAPPPSYPPHTPGPNFSGLVLLWPSVLHSPFTYTQSGPKCREESFHYLVELEATLLLYLRWKSKPVYS